MKKALWHLGAFCLAVWIAVIAIMVGTSMALPRFDPTKQQSGCYMRDALWFYIECSPSMPGGRVAAAIGSFAWTAPLWISAAGHYAASPVEAARALPRSLERRAVGAAFMSFWTLTFFGAGAYLVAAERRIRRPTAR